jgi:hypothetical protein
MQNKNHTRERVWFFDSESWVANAYLSKIDYAMHFLTQECNILATHLIHVSHR